MAIHAKIRIVAFVYFDYVFDWAKGQHDIHISLSEHGTL